MSASYESSAVCLRESYLALVEDIMLHDLMVYAIERYRAVIRRFCSLFLRKQRKQRCNYVIKSVVKKAYTFVVKIRATSVAVTLEVSQEFYQDLLPYIS